VLRPLVEVALENAREGCVREAFAALETLHQARHAHAPEVREALASVATDELAHAELAFAAQDWLASRMSEDERTACRAHATETLAQLDAALPDHDTDTEYGLPGPEVSRMLKAQLRRYLGDRVPASGAHAHG
jgi:Mn-containing catalase